LVSIGVFLFLINITLENMSLKKSKLLLVLIVSILISSCQQKGCTDPSALNYDANAKKDDNSCEYEDFDKQGLLSNIANNYIIPSMDNYKANVITLDSLVESFTQTPSEQALVDVRNAWVNTLLSWQDISFLDFGPANYIILKEQTNLFPADTVLIDSNISTGTWNLDYNSNYDAKGFQALDYLLNKRGYTDAELVTNLTGTENSKNYLNDITDDLLSNINYVSSEWETYKDNFINDYANNSQGSAVSNMINALCLHYEFYVRRGKVGLPLGVFNGFSQQEMPELVECYHYGQSLPFCKRAVTSLKNYINGVSYSSEENGLGFDDYMNFVNAQYNNEQLSAVINNQFDEILTGLNSINDPLSNEVIANKADVQAVYQKMQQLVPFIKVDMTSSLGVLITYQDNDGD
tara:strand:+ start:5985 stop:7202 length:1218 start_codon:yes stop_codon:yes gene_type:complete